MITKSKLWFLTLSSIILVLALYYVLIPVDGSLTVFSHQNSEDNTSIKIEESEIITAMKVAEEEENMQEIQMLQEILLDSAKTANEKSDAYDKIQNINSLKSVKEKMEKELNTEFKFDCFVSIKDNNVKVVVADKEKSAKLANDIISYINKNNESDFYITVKFE